MSSDAGTGRAPPSISSDAGKTRLADPIDEAGQGGDPGLRRDPRGLVVVAQRAQETSKLGHRVATDRLDGEHRLLGLVR